MKPGFPVKSFKVFLCTLAPFFSFFYIFTPIFVPVKTQFVPIALAESMKNDNNNPADSPALWESPWVIPKELGSF